MAGMPYVMIGELSLLEVEVLIDPVVLIKIIKLCFYYASHYKEP